jgi:2-keto-4-pentenoate hydratase
MIRKGFIVLVTLVLSACFSAQENPDAKVSNSLVEACDLAGFASSYAQFSNPSQWLEIQCALQFLQSVEQSEKVQWDYAQKRNSQYPIIGYKVALGSANVQQLFALNKPVVGLMFKQSLLPNGSMIKKSSAVNLAYEPDLLAVVKSAEINHAKSIQDLAPHIDRLVAFLEVPDLLIKPGPSSGPAFIATNAAFRWGVMGDSIIARSDTAFLDSLKTMTVNTIDISAELDAGAETENQILSSAKGGAVMGHPYNAILFLLDQLHQRGVQLAAGDMISLGAYASPKPVGGIQQVRVEYIGIDGAQTLTVSAKFHP